MRIAVTSQNFRTVTGHAGKSRRFLVYEVDAGGTLCEVERFDLPPYMSIHDFDYRQPHPLDIVQVLITGGCGDGFIHRMARRGVRVIVTGESDPQTAVIDLLTGRVKPQETSSHEHSLKHEHAQRAETHSCGCHG